MMGPIRLNGGERAQETARGAARLQVRILGTATFGLSNDLCGLFVFPCLSQAAETAIRN